MRLSEKIRSMSASKASMSEDTIADLESVIEEFKHVAQAGDTYIFAYRGIQGCSLHRASGNQYDYQQFRQQHLFDPKPCFAFYRIDVESLNRGTVLEIDLQESLQILEKAKPQMDRKSTQLTTAEQLISTINDAKVVRQMTSIQGLSKGDQLLVRVTPKDSNHYRVDATIMGPRHLVDRNYIVPSEAIQLSGNSNMLFTVHHSAGHESYSSRIDLTSDQASSLLSKRKTLPRATYESNSLSY